MYHTALALIGPVLFVQGRYVRRVTPRLPEPCGPREGCQGGSHSQPHSHGRPLRLLIVGDSAAAGVGVDEQAQALSGQLVARLSEQVEVNWRLLAKTGDTLAQLLEHLQSVAPSVADVVVVSIGVNDVTAMTKKREWQANLVALVGLLQQRFSAAQVILSAVPPMHLFPALPQPLRWWLGLRAGQLNQTMQVLAGQYPALSFVPVVFPPERRLMATDGFHPGALAYQQWACVLAQKIMAQHADEIAHEAPAAGSVVSRQEFDGEGQDA